ncbi:compound eye opsin BCRH2-like [Oratosquilla oratoria]|uniref:compound eye opsin BCRH2-like n=1 Tax=Oratosquilla oratoria TaxID=337810 RepID=UPI003F765CF7
MFPSIFNGTGPQALARTQDFSFGYPDGVVISDLVPDHMKEYVHPHWMNFPPVNPMVHYILGVVYLFLGTAAICGNGIVLYVFLKTKNLRTPANMLVVNLSFSDLCMLLSQFPWFAWNCFMGGVWYFSPFMCELYACLGAITGLCSLWSLVFISYDRYNVIVRGMNGTKLTSGMAFGMMMFCWGYGILMSIFPFIGWGKYIPEGILDSCSFDYLTRDWNVRSHGLCLFICCFCIPLLCIAFFYVSIIKAICAHEAAMRAQAKKMNVSNLRSSGESDGDSAEVRIAKVAVTNVSLWLICWTPYAAIVVQGMFFDQASITPLVSMLPALLAKTASCYNPMIYAISHPRYRLALQKELPWLCIHEEAPSSKASNDSQSTVTKDEKE